MVKEWTENGESRQHETRLRHDIVCHESIVAPSPSRRLSPSPQRHQMSLCVYECALLTDVACRQCAPFGIRGMTRAKSRAKATHKRQSDAWATNGQNNVCTAAGTTKRNAVCSARTRRATRARATTRLWQNVGNGGRAWRCRYTEDAVTTPRAGYER